MNDWINVIGIALSLLYALLCLGLTLLWSRPQLIRRCRVKLPQRVFSPAKVIRLREAWRDLELAACALAAMAFAEDAFEAVLGLLMLALVGLAAQAIGDDILAQKKER